MMSIPALHLTAAACRAYRGQRHTGRSAGNREPARVGWESGALIKYIVTNLKGRSKRVVRIYNARGTAEQWIKEGKNAVKWTKLSCRRFKDNAARPHLFALAYNLANFL